MSCFFIQVVGIGCCIFATSLFLHLKLYTFFIYNALCIWYISNEKQKKMSMERVFISDCEAIPLPPAPENITQRKIEKNQPNSTSNEVRKSPNPSQPSIKCHYQKVATGSSRGGVLKAGTWLPERQWFFFFFFLVTTRRELREWLGPRRGGNAPVGQTMWLCRKGSLGHRKETEIADHIYDQVIEDLAAHPRVTAWGTEGWRRASG